MSQHIELHEILDTVADPQSFLVFARALLADRMDEVKKEKLHPSSPYGPGANGWENGTIESFLEAAIAWAESSKFAQPEDLSTKNPWRQFAKFLYCGKIYE